MTDTERQELREAAERATFADKKWGWCETEDGPGAIPLFAVAYFSVGNVPIAWTHEERDARFLALANPAAILSLLDKRDALSEQVERLKGERDDLIGSVAAHVTVRGEYYARAQAAESRAEALTRENEGLRAKGQTLLAALAVNGWPVSDEHWRRASGQMSIQARALHLAATDFKAALSLPTADEPAKGEA